MRIAFRRAAALCRPQIVAPRSQHAFFSAASGAAPNSQHEDEIGDAWRDEWTAATDAGATAATDAERASGSRVSGYEASADQLRALIKTGLLRFTDLRDRPARQDFCKAFW